jgi:hypothetical protein
MSDHWVIEQTHAVLPDLGELAILPQVQAVTRRARGRGPSEQGKRCLPGSCSQAKTTVGTQMAQWVPQSSSGDQGPLDAPRFYRPRHASPPLFARLLARLGVPRADSAGPGMAPALAPGMAPAPGQGAAQAGPARAQQAQARQAQARQAQARQAQARQAQADQARRLSAQRAARL